MKIYAISMDRNIIAIGFRRVVAAAKQAGYKIDSIYFLDYDDKASLAGSWWQQKTGVGFSVNYIQNDSAIRKLGELLSDGDVIAFSLMSVQRNIGKKICDEIRRVNPKAKIIIGGYHPTLDPEDCISFCDILIQGEGERAFVKFLNRVRDGSEITGIPNTWVNTGTEIHKHPRAPLMSADELEKMPFMDYTLEDQFFFSYETGELRPVTMQKFLTHVGTTYNTIWSVGCPHRCSFCSQSKFIDLDKDYAKYRGPSPEYIIKEIKEVMKSFPIDYVIFYDSNFLGRSEEELARFAELFKREIGIKFILSGTNPVSVTKRKFEILTNSGLCRIKIGIEAANTDILKLYRRAAQIPTIKNALAILSEFKNRMAAPALEVILDNPMETVSNLYDSIQLLGELSPPFTMNLFSLQFMPYTELSEKYASEDIVKSHIDKEYMFSYRPTAINILISIFAVIHPPRFLLRSMLMLIKGREERLYPRLKSIFYKCSLIRRALNQARFGDYSTFPWYIMLTYHRVKALFSKLNFLSRRIGYSRKEPEIS
ncbi:MAG: radical SAM protein [Oligoflexales bacterium]|nr:radical SAM protein [Oligoflexales bacterium]